MKLFIDAMGGDQAPKVVFHGLRRLRKSLQATPVLLGPESSLAPHLKKLEKSGLSFEFIHCSEVIDMKDAPLGAVRSKRDSSIVRGLTLAAQTPDSAFFSAGSSGAVFAAALLSMGKIPGVDRPAIAAILPTLTGHCILLDAGANVECRPQHLLEFAHMGTAYAQVYLRAENPTVGVLSNGEEDSKGTDLTRQSLALLRSDLSLRSIGYVEGKEMFSGSVDVVVTDGFTGNIALKTAEGLGKAVSATIRAELGRSLGTRLGALFAMPALKRVQKKLDYAEVGAAPLLGVRGNCFIGHGRSNAKAIANGILRAQEAIVLGLDRRVLARFKERT